MLLSKNGTFYTLIVTCSISLFAAENNKMHTFFVPALAKKNTVEINFFNNSLLDLNVEKFKIEFFCFKLDYNNAYWFPMTTFENFKSTKNKKERDYIEKNKNALFSVKTISDLHEIAHKVKKHNDKNSTDPHEIVIDESTIQKTINAYLLYRFFDELEIANKNIFPNNELDWFYKKCFEKYI